MDTCVIEALPGGQELEGRVPATPRKRKRRSRLAPQAARARTERWLYEMAIVFSILDHGELTGKLRRGEVTGLRAIAEDGRAVYSCHFLDSVTEHEVCLAVARVCLLDLRIDCVLRGGAAMTFLPPLGPEARRFAPR
ncbi:MAG: hypothetical protein KBC36_09525 [Spirochaetia bacterium]|nr:hypothetical protein [Spirochaetia bacterium]